MPETNSDQARDTHEATVGSPKKGGVAMVIVVAVLISVGLITLGLMVYDSKDEPQPTETKSEQTASEIPDRSAPLNVEAVKEETSQIDKLIEDLDNESDFDDGDLSDEAVGL